MSAVMVPLLFSMFDMVMPAVGLALVTVSERLPAVESASATVAMVDFQEVAPPITESPPPAVTVGIALTVKVITASVVALQLSVARTVIRCTPTGAAFEIETTPVELLTVMEPVKVPLLLIEIEFTEPLSLGVVVGLIMFDVPALIIKVLYDIDGGEFAVT